MSDMKDIYALLCQLGITRNYNGFFYIAYAVKLCTEQQERMTLVTKQLYPEVAGNYKTNWKAVERDIRTVSNIIWTKNRALLEEMAGEPILEKPKTVQLLSILLYELEKRGA